jgi:fluoroacetyl-CoA thioesterase
MPLEPGLCARITHEVAEEDSALSCGSGDVPVLATPRVVALVEQASVKAVAGQLDATSTTVGMRVQLDHLAPTAIGTEVTAEATLEKVEGRRLTFTVAVRDARSLVAAGKVTRVVVDGAAFLSKCG